MQFSSTTLVSVLGAFALVLSLILLSAGRLRSAGLARFGFVPPQARRLSVLEALPIDRSRRLLIVRCDNREALILTGNPSDLMMGWLDEKAAKQDTAS